MSHKVTVDTHMTDRVALIQSLLATNTTYRESGNVVTITSGPCKNSTVNTKTGKVVGDTDHRHTEANLGLLRQSYAEAKFRLEADSEGIQIQERRVESGQIKLRCLKA